MIRLLKTHSSDFMNGHNYILKKRFIKKGKHYPPHGHEFFEFEIIISGEGVHTYNDTTYTVTAGDAYLISYRDFHAFSAVSDVTLLSLQFSGAILADEINSYLSLNHNRFKCKFDEKETEEIVHILDTIADEISEKAIYSDIVIKNAISNLTIKILRNSSYTEVPFAPSLVQLAIGYINNNFKHDISLSDIAKEFSVTPNYMGSLIFKWTGCSFSEYLNTMRIDYASNLLISSNLSVKEIAFSSGYNSVEYFTYVFKKLNGASPLKFRNDRKTI